MDHRLKKDKQFSYIYRKGRKTHSAHLTLFSVESKFKTYKIGYVISKKVGKANKRNRLKRRLREIVRLADFAGENHNYVLMAKPGAAELDFGELKRQVSEVFTK